jgi:hypothetical protein
LPTGATVLIKEAYKNISKYSTPDMDQYINKRTIIEIRIIIVLGIIVDSPNKKSIRELPIATDKQKTLHCCKALVTFLYN